MYKFEGNLVREDVPPQRGPENTGAGCSFNFSRFGKACVSYRYTIFGNSHTFL